ncbi:MAG: hypothetical protein NC548_32390 [Lachnospiraceae bacterium]|nr:hypothetical protein [Lachnospiraceae bacterium]
MESVIKKIDKIINDLKLPYGDLVITLDGSICLRTELFELSTARIEKTINEINKTFEAKSIDYSIVDEVNSIVDFALPFLACDFVLGKE